MLEDKLLEVKSVDQNCNLCKELQKENVDEHFTVLEVLFEHILSEVWRELEVLKDILQLVVNEVQLLRSLLVSVFFLQVTRVFFAKSLCVFEGSIGCFKQDALLSPYLLRIH